MSDVLGALMGPGAFFDDHTFRMAFFGTAVIGLVAGALGSFAYLRKQSLISDVISHSALPGTLGAFLLAVVVLEVDGRNMAVLMLGAVVAGTLAVGLAQYVTRATKLSIDAAMAITLSLFFGAGMLLMRIISNGAYPGKGGIQDYLFGNASVITKADLIASISVGTAALVLMVVFWEEFTLRTFDPDHSTVLGFHARAIDAFDVHHHRDCHPDWRESRGPGADGRVRGDPTVRRTAMNPHPPGHGGALRDHRGPRQRPGSLPLHCGRRHCRPGR